MDTRRLAIAGAAMLAALAVSPVQAIIGVGVHYGMDFSLDLADKRDQQLQLPGLTLSATAPDLGPPPVGIPAEIPSALLPVYITRTGFDRTAFNLGAKVLVDAIKWFEIEASGNFGIWEYQAEIKYPSAMSYRAGADPTTASSPADLFDITYATLPITCKALGIDFLWLDFTPYAKLNADLTIKKAFLKVPKRLQTLKMYAGAGASLHLATPVLSAELIEDVLAEHLGSAQNTVQELGPDLFGNRDIMDAVLGRILDGLTEPKWGAHIVAGAQIKVPVIPLAFYIDGKFMIPFGELDEYTGLTGYGFLVNGGLMLKF